MCLRIAITGKRHPLPLLPSISSWVIRSYPLDSKASQDVNSQEEGHLGGPTHSLQWDKILLEAGLNFLYQDQIVTHLFGVWGWSPGPHTSSTMLSHRAAFLSYSFPPVIQFLFLSWYVYLLSTLLTSHLCAVDSCHLCPSFRLSDTQAPWKVWAVPSSLLFVDWEFPGFLSLTSLRECFQF